VRAPQLLGPRPPLPRAADPWWRLAGLGGAVGGAVVAGVLLLVLAGVASFGLAPAWRAEAEQLRAAASALRAERLAAADRARQAAAAAAPPTVWPAAGNEAQRVRVLLGLAQRHGVLVRALRQERVARGSGRVAAADKGAATWHLVAMSAEGPYPALRRFVAAALQADAALALDSLLLQRADTTTAVLRAELGWAFGSATP
jgi:hypothetical protein